MTERTLDEITRAARRNEEVSLEELLLAVCAYDVLVASLDLGGSAALLKKYFQFANAKPGEYLTEDNSPYNETFVKWHKAMDIVMIAVAEEVET